MKTYQEMQAERSAALAVFEKWGIDPSEDFFTLTPSQVCMIVEEADRQKYRKPKNANGSRGRYFYARMQRKARDRAFSGWL